MQKVDVQVLLCLVTVARLGRLKCNGALKIPNAGTQRQLQPWLALGFLYPHC